MTNDTEENDVLAAIELRRTQLEQDVVTKEAAWEEAKLRLSTFRASALSALGAASGSKSAQKQRSERQSVVAKMLAEGLSRAEIVRRTGLVDHLVGYDIDCLRRSRKKQGTKKVFATSPEQRKAVADLEDPSVEDEDEDEVPKEDEGVEDLSVDYVEETGKTGISPPAATEPPKDRKTDAPFASSEPGKPGVVRPGCSASRDQLKAAAKAIQRSGRKTCFFVTTTDKGHSHVVSLDLMGDGASLVDDTKHRHRACRFELIESDHLHGITLEQR